MSDISREELVAFTEAHSKSAIALEKITESLEHIAKSQEKILEKVANGLANAIIIGVTENYNNVHKETITSLGRIESTMIDCSSKMAGVVEDKVENSAMSKDVEHTKWLVGIIGIVIIVCVVIMRVIGTESTNKTVTAQTIVLEDLLRHHMAATEPIVPKP